MISLKGRNFLKLLDFTPEEIQYLIDLAADLKAKKKAGIPHASCAGKSVALIFEKTSTRTRCSFEVGAFDLGMHFVACAPEKYFPDKELVAQCQAVAKETGATLEFITDPMRAVPGANVIYTDIWVSMGEPKEAWTERIADLKPYRVTMELMNAAGPQCKFEHCLPSFHDLETTIGLDIYNKFGEECLEVTNEVFESDRSIVFDEAENRLHSIKAVMAATL